MRFSTFWFLDFQKLVFWRQERRMKPSETLPPRKPRNKPERRSRCVISKTYAKNAGADPEQTRSRPGAETPLSFIPVPTRSSPGEGMLFVRLTQGGGRMGPAC